MSPALAGRILTTSTTWKAPYSYNKMLFCYKREYTATYYNMNKPWKHTNWRSQSQKATDYMITFIWKSRMDKSTKIEVILVSCHSELGGKREGKEVTSKGYGESWWDDANVLK